MAAPATAAIPTTRRTPPCLVFHATPAAASATTSPIAVPDSAYLSASRPRTRRAHRSKRG
jgi:hypothetical protein